MSAIEFSGISEKNSCICEMNRRKLHELKSEYPQLQARCAKLKESLPSKLFSKSIKVYKIFCLQVVCSIKISD